MSDESHTDADLLVGQTKWFNADKGYGFVEVESLDGDVFVHQSDIEMAGYRELFEGQTVHVEVEETPRGWSATKAVPVFDDGDEPETE